MAQSTYSVGGSPLLRKMRSNAVSSFDYNPKNKIEINV